MESSVEVSSADDSSWTAQSAIARLQQQEDLGQRYYAAWWLGKNRVRTPEAVEALWAALTDEADRTPDGGYPLRRNAATALGKLGDRRVVSALIDCLQCEDYYVRESAAEALGMLGDATAIPALVGLLEGGVAAAVEQAGKPHLVQPYAAILEAIGMLQASDASASIQPFLEHPVPKVQYSAARALYQLTREDKYGKRLEEALLDDKLQLRRSALMDLGAIGYLPAAEAIAATLAENSLKIISLKGLLEYELIHGEKQLPELSSESLRIMDLMDSLL
ncbi:HEAT repeat domain-containing protein [Oscillatoria sp. FACHB-1406]|uniref:HEAT repeat domain-containing protein n=1 Tax=Oscillatoria sp. FACHB-1406 TaxID=2692846 RepID=UPI0018EF52BD|nr:HEAT repeat domain-containing protein [Oscillatoria sp. FACHB-1406]